MAFDPTSLGAVPVDGGSPPAATPPPFDPTTVGAVPVPDAPPAQPDAPAAAPNPAAPPAFDPTTLGAIPAPTFDPTALGAQPVDDGASAYIDQQRQTEAQSVPQRILNTAKGIGEGLWGFATDTVPGIIKGAYGLATDPTLTPGQKLLAAGNTVLSNLATLPYLAKNAVTGAHNIVERNFGSGVTDQEYAQQYRDLQDQSLTRRAFLNNGLQTMFGYNDGQDPSTYSTLPATAEQYQEQLAPLLDVTNAIPFAGGALARLGRAATVDAGVAATRAMIPGVARRVASSLLDRGAGATDAAASTLDTVRNLPRRGLEAMGVPPEAAEHMAGAPIHLLAGAMGGAEAILPILAGEAAPGLLRQFSAVQRAASQAVLTGESTESFVGRMAQSVPPGTFTRTLLNALDQTGLARVMGTVADVAGSGIKGGVLNPLVPLQFLASSSPEEFGQQLGQNVGFGLAGAGAAHAAGDSPAQVASRNYNDVVQFGARLARQSGADDQLAAYNAMPFRAQVAVAQFANTRPDVDVVLRPGADNTTSLSPDGRRTVTLNTSNPAAAVAHIAAHEYVHSLMMVDDNRSRVVSALMGSPELGTDGPLGRWADGMFVPSEPFRRFIGGYSAALGRDGATVGARADLPFYQYMAEEFYAETMASRLAGTNATGETGLARVYRSGDTISKMVDAVTGRSGSGILDYLDRKYAQGRIAPRFGTAELEGSIKAGPHARLLTGLQVLGMRALRQNETRSGRPREYSASGHVEPTFSLNELRQNPAAAARLFGASNDLVFAPDGTLQGQRTRAQANAASRAQGKIWFDTLSKMPPALLPPGAVRAVARTDAKGRQAVELEGKFLTDGQIDALVRANGLNRYQEGVLRQVNRALQAQDGNVHHVTYQTASDGRGKYATLASSTRDMVVRQIRVTKDRNIILDSFDADQFLHNYDRMMQAAVARGGRTPIAHPEQALRDYLANQALGYTGAGQPLDAAHPPAKPPARVFSAHDANVVNELFGVGTRDNAGVNPVFHEMDEAGQQRSRTTFKSFRLDRINSIEATPDVLPVDYYRVKYNRSPNYGQDEEDAVRSPHGQNLPAPDGVRVHPSPAPQVAPGPADRPQPAVPGDGRPDLRPRGDRQEPRGDARQAAGAAGPRDADRAPHPDARGRVPDPQDARLLAPYSPDAGRRVQFSPNSADDASRPGDPRVRELARRWRAAVPGLGPEHSGYAPVDEALSRRVADAYQALRSDPDDPRVRAAYDAFINETMAQWNAAHAAGYRFEPWLRGGQPYATSREMLADLAQNRHLYYFPSVPEGGIGAFGEGEGVDLRHPLLREVGHWNGTPVVANDVFRAVHDMFGYSQGGFEFGPRGELNAYLEHRGMYTPLARQAMTAETMGQNSWVNFGAHMRRPDGTIPARGDADYVPLQDRRYAEQKAAVLPPEVMSRLEGVSHSPNSDLEDLVEKMPRVQTGADVSGLRVRKDIPNTASIRASFGSEYTSHGVREVPMSMFNIQPGRERPLADQIRQSGEINPLIVAVDGHPDGPAYILEGSHRIDALRTLGVPTFPALVVIDRMHSPNSLDEGGIVGGNEPSDRDTDPRVLPGGRQRSPGGAGGDVRPELRPVSPQRFFNDYIRATGRNPQHPSLQGAADHLLKYAAETHQLISPRERRAIEAYRWPHPSVEHDVFLVPPDAPGVLRGTSPNGSIIKITRPGKWGIRGTDLGYFKSLHDQDVITGGKLGTEVMGIMVHGAGAWPSVVTRMNFIAGDKPAKGDLHNFLTTPVDRGGPGLEWDGLANYHDPDSDLEILDGHAGNFIRTPDGRFVPIDIYIRGDVAASGVRFSPNSVDSGGRETIVNPNEAAQEKGVPGVPRKGAPGRVQQPPPGPDLPGGLTAERHQPPESAAGAAASWAPRLVALRRDQDALRGAGYDLYNRHGGWWPEGVARTGADGPERVFLHQPATSEGLSEHWDGHPEPWQSLPDETLPSGEGLREVARRAVQEKRAYAKDLVEPMMDVDRTGAGWLPDQLPQPLADLRDYHTIWLKKPGLPERNWRDGEQELTHQGQRFTTRWDDWTADKDYMAHANVSVMPGPDGRDRVVVWEAQPTYRLPKADKTKKEAAEPAFAGLTRSEVLESLAHAVRDFARERGNLPIVLGDARTVQDVYGRRGPVSRTFNHDYSSEGYATRAFKAALGMDGRPLRKVELPGRLWMPHHDESERHGFTGYEFPSTP